jgi:hypothetical protein
VVAVELVSHTVGSGNIKSAFCPEMLLEVGSNIFLCESR